MELERLITICANQPKYRLTQVNQLIFKDLIDDWDQAFNLPLTLRSLLSKEFPLGINSQLISQKDNPSLKAIITLKDGLQIETVLMKHQGGRNTVCLSSQVGCSLGCTFCLTGKMGFKRNLTQDEIITQVLFWQRYLKKVKEKVGNLVFMGMGEPFLNFENVWSAIGIINNKEYFNIGARHISISTAGIVEGINKLSQKSLQVNLAISLHAPNNELRSQLMPVNKQYSIEAILKAVGEYVYKTKRKVMFEYILIDGVNDKLEHALQLIKILKHYLYFVNLIPYNPTGVYQRSSEKRIKEFQEVLGKHHLPATLRYLFGDKIQAACGQLNKRF